MIVFRYLLRQLWSSLITLLGVLTLVFFLLRYLPGSPFDEDKSFPPEIMQELERAYGLHLPLWQQYLRWLAHCLQGDWGVSLHYGGDYSVLEILMNGLSVSVKLGFGALVLSLIFAVVAATIRTLNPRTWLAFCLDQASDIGAFIPSFLICSILILIFSIYLKWLPAGLVEEPSGWILPIIVLASRPFSLFYRLLVAEFHQILHLPFMRTALAKGLHPSKAMLKHGLKNALLPLLSTLGPMASQLLTGSFVIELMFQLPGLGKHFLTSVTNRDYPMVMGVTLIYGLFLIVIQLLSECAMAWVDPRVREGLME